MDGSYAAGGKYHAQIAKNLQPSFATAAGPVMNLNVFVLVSMLATAHPGRYNLSPTTSLAHSAHSAHSAHCALPHLPGLPRALQRAQVLQGASGPRGRQLQAAPLQPGAHSSAQLAQSAYSRHTKYRVVAPSCPASTRSASPNPSPSPPQPHPRLYQVVIGAFGLAALLCGSIMAAGFSTFGAASQGFILNNYATADSLALLARIGISASIIFSFPLNFVGLREGVLDLLKLKARAHMHLQP